MTQIRDSLNWSAQHLFSERKEGVFARWGEERGGLLIMLGGPNVASQNLIIHTVVCGRNKLANRHCGRSQKRQFNMSIDFKNGNATYVA